jgi:hypothetical protein
VRMVEKNKGTEKISDNNSGGSVPYMGNQLFGEPTKQAEGSNMEQGLGWS